MDKRDEVERLLANIQFDRWIFGFPTWFTVVSHGHEDHDPFLSSVALAEPLIFGPKFVDRFAEVAKTVKRLPRHRRLSDGEAETLTLNGRVRIRCLGRKSLEKLTGESVERLHADWWTISTKKLLIFFIGELDGVELPVLRRLLEEFPNIDVVILPSYGRILDLVKHRLSDAEQLRREIAEIAQKEKERGRLVYALPHPVTPSWAVKSAHHI